LRPMECLDALRCELLVHERVTPFYGFSSRVSRSGKWRSCRRAYSGVPDGGWPPCRRNLHTLHYVRPRSIRDRIKRRSGRDLSGIPVNHDSTFYIC
jgi:hypothetical protein